MVGLPLFQGLDKPEYEKNAGRIKDVANLNETLAKRFSDMTSEELIAMFNQIGLPISNINSIPQVLEDPLIKRRLLKAKDPQSGLELTLAAPPCTTPFLESTDRTLPFPPRFGEHNKEIYCDALGYAESDLAAFKENGVI